MRRRSAAPLALLLGWMLAAQACAPRYISLTKQGDVLMDKGDLEGAEKRYAAAVDSFKYAPAIYKLGLLEVKKGSWETAEKFFSAAVVEDPLMREAWRWRGECSLRKADIERAISDFKKARELGSTDAQLGLGIAAYLRGDPELAFSSLEVALTDPKSVEDALRFTWKTALLSSAWPRAIALLHKAAVGEKSSAKSLQGRLLADAAYMAQDYPAALKSLEQIDEKVAFGFWYREPSAALLSRLGSIKGAVVEYIHLGSPAMKAGLLPADVIISLERKPIKSAKELTDALTAYRKRATHDDILLEVFRDGAVLGFRLTPDLFQTRALVDSAAAGSGGPVLSQAPDGDMVFP